MKIAVSASDKGPDAPFEPHFGRCAYFVIYDTDAGTYVSVANPGGTAGGGAGIQAAQAVVRGRPGVVISGSIGPNAYEVLDRAGIKCYRGSGPSSVRDSIAAYIEGSLRQLNPAGRVGAGAGTAGNRAAGKKAIRRLTED
ncbi:MAG: NifB/NifX family molybdenum-iron cluster-binding protein [Bacillota bacterium]